MKTLFFDIETTPNVSYTWGKYDQNVIAFQREWELLSFAFKDIGKVAVHSRRKLSEKQLVKKLHETLSKADILVAHNGKSFDMKMANAKFVQFGLKPLPPKVIIDTKVEAKRYFRFTSNKLDDLGQRLGVGRKMHTGGFDLWLECMAGNKAAFMKMERYNKQDVQLLERVYNKLLPWIKHPNVYVGVCNRCKSGPLQKRGFYETSISVFQRYQCKQCGGWSKSETRSFGKVVKADL